MNRRCARSIGTYFGVVNNCYWHLHVLTFPLKMNYYSVMNGSSLSDNNETGRGAKRRARTRADLIAAARKVFARRGYHDASIVEITEMADVGVGTFYLHFRDKDEVFMSLLEEGLRGLRERVLAAVERAAPRQRLTVAIAAIFRHAYEERELFQIALSGGKRLTPAFQAQSGMTEGFTLALEEAQAQGLLEGYDIPLLARFITGIVTQGIIYWFEHDEPGPEAMAEQALRLLRNGLPEALFVDVIT
jgi:AcrR family transcriptional regulator